MKKNKKVHSAAKVTPKKSEMSSSVIPLGDRILLKPLTSKNDAVNNSFGIIIPDTVTKEAPEQGRVIAVGEGRYQDGKIIPMKVKVGDTVIFSKYGYDEVKVDDESLYILREDSILAIIK